MNLFEFYNTFPKEYQDKETDGSKLEIEDTRKTRLTLKQIHQLRKMNDVRTVEKEQELKKLKKIYGKPPEQPQF